MRLVVEVIRLAIFWNLALKNLFPVFSLFPFKRPRAILPDLHIRILGSPFPLDVQDLLVCWTPLPVLALLRKKQILTSKISTVSTVWTFNHLFKQTGRTTLLMNKEKNYTFWTRSKKLQNSAPSCCHTPGLGKCSCRQVFNPWFGFHYGVSLRSDIC